MLFNLGNLQKYFISLWQNFFAIPVCECHMNHNRSVVSAMSCGIMATACTAKCQSLTRGCLGVHPLLIQSYS